MTDFWLTGLLSSVDDSQVTISDILRKSLAILNKAFSGKIRCDSELEEGEGSIVVSSKWSQSLINLLCNVVSVAVTRMVWYEALLLLCLATVVF